MEPADALKVAGKTPLHSTWVTAGWSLASHSNYALYGERFKGVRLRWDSPESGYCDTGLKLRCTSDQ
jgi:hypothetical protein